MAHDKEDKQPAVGIDFAGILLTNSKFTDKALFYLIGS